MLIIESEPDGKVEGWGVEGRMKDERPRRGEPTCYSGPRRSASRPTTNQIARTGTSPLLNGRCGTGRIEGDRVTRADELVLLERDQDASGAADDAAVLPAVVAHQRMIRRRRATHLVCGLEEVDAVLFAEDRHLRLEEPAEETDDPRLGRPEAAVRPVHRRRVNLNEHLVGPGRRRLDVRDPDHLRRAVPHSHGGLHRGNRTDSTSEAAPTAGYGNAILRPTPWASARS